MQQGGLHLVDDGRRQVGGGEVDGPAGKLAGKGVGHGGNLLGVVDPVER
jgi:hypothetical protein